MAATRDWMAGDGVRGLVSVIIPTHNREALLAATLQSVFRQDYRPIQVIVVDDASDDGTEGMVSDLQQQLPAEVELKYVKQAQAGAPAARNRGGVEASGEFIVFMDDDDLFNSKFLSSAVAELHADGDAVLAYCRWQRFMEFDSKYHILKSKKGEFPASARTAWEALLVGWTWLLQSCVIRREYVRDVGPWSLSLLKSQDLDYKVRLAAASGKMVEAREAAVFYRVHENSISGRLNEGKIKSYTQVMDDVEAIATARSDYKELTGQIADFFWAHSYWLYSMGYLKAGLRTLRQAMRHDSRIGLRKGNKLSRLLHAVGLGKSSGAILFQLFRAKNWLLGKREAQIIATLSTLPDQIEDD